MAVQLRKAARRIAPSLMVAVGLLGASAGSASATDFYVSPTGSDAAAGTIGAPFRTLARAQTAVRATTPTMRADVIVHVRAGTYTLTSPLALDASRGDSGINGFDVIWQAYGYGTRAPETPVISGGQTVSGWSLFDAGTNVWRADLGSLSTRQLYKNGVRLEQGRLTALPGTVTRTATGYRTTSLAPQSWSNKSSIELVYTNVGPYSESRCGVASITGNGSSSTITMDSPCFDWATTVFTYNAEDPSTPLTFINPTRVTNSVSFLSAGQWAIDRSNAAHNYLYYRGASGENPTSSTFVVPKLQTIVSGVGTVGAPLHDVAFKGLTFQHGTWLAPDSTEGLVQIYGDYIYDGGSPSGSLTEPTTQIYTIPGNLEFTNTRYLLFEGNRFKQMGGDALDMIGTKDNVFRGNLFADLAAGALKLDGLNDGTSANDSVENNYVHDAGNDYGGSIAVYTEDLVNPTFRHNQVNDVSYSGIAATISEVTSPTGLDMLDNKVFDTVNAVWDGGGLYTSNRQGTSYGTGAQITGNLVYDTRNPYITSIDPTGTIGSPNAIYNDVDADYITLTRNVIYDNHQSWGGVFPLHMTFTGSYWDDDRLVWYGDTRYLSISGNTLLNARTPAASCAGIPACNAIVANAGLEAAWQYLLTL